MGNTMTEMGRNEPLPGDIDDPLVQTHIMLSWHPQRIYDDFSSLSQRMDRTTQSPGSMMHAGRRLGRILPIGTPLTILEVFAGNCRASNLVRQAMGPHIGRWIATDVASYNREPPVAATTGLMMSFEQLDAVTAVDKYGREADVLLMISPPPSSQQGRFEYYGDYYACRDYLRMTTSIDPQRRRYIVFIGELGNSDGSTGMYRYLMEHEQLTLLQEVILDVSKDIFGGDCVKSMYVFMVAKAAAE